VYVELTGFLVELAGQLDAKHHDLIWDRLIRIDLQLRAMQANEGPPLPAEHWRQRHRVLPGLAGPIGGPSAPDSRKPGLSLAPRDRSSR
jgi:hypothetical protein